MTGLSSNERRVPRVWLGVVRLLEWGTLSLFGILTLDVLWGVASRYVLGSQSRWTEEVAIYLLVWVSLLGAAIVYRERGHLGVDFLVTKLHPDAQRIVALLIELAVMVFAGFVLVYGGLVLVFQTLAAGQITPALGWKMGYLYSVVPISGVSSSPFQSSTWSDTDLHRLRRRREEG